MTALRVTIHRDHAPHEPETWLAIVEDGTSVKDLATALDVHPQALVGYGDADVLLSETGIVSGLRIGAAPAPLDPPGATRLEIVGGPLSGNTVELTPGYAYSLGLSDEAAITLADPHLLPLHATLTPTTGHTDGTGPLALHITPAPGADVVVNGVVLTDASVSVVPADLVQMGAHIFRFGLAPSPDADLAEETARRGFNRPSRITLPAAEPVVVLPGDRPQTQENTPLPWLSAVVPVVLGVTMAILFNRAVMLIMAFASPVMVIGSFLTNRKLARRRGERTDHDWQNEVKAAEDRIDALVREQRLRRWYDMPDPVTLRDIATRPLSRLWERRFDDRDALVVRVGVAQEDLVARYEGGSQEYRIQPVQAGVSPTPVSVDLAAGTLGLAGTRHATRLTARALLASVATLRSPRDCQVVILCDGQDEALWEWATWLPHMHEDVPVGALIGNSDDSRRERMRELSHLLETRRRAAAQGVGVSSHVVVLVDGARQYRMLPGMVEVLKHGHLFGIFVIALDTDTSRLPEEAATVIDIDRDDPAMARLTSGSGFTSRLLLDGVSLSHADQIARALSGYRHISGIGEDGVMPRSVRFVDLMALDLDAPADLIERWSRSPRHTYVVVGADADGEVALDLATGGPHALVAGTTGSGKSEFLQTLIMALALANRPDALTFVLVDYKGGSAFADCARLPHTVGMVTNLDARETERALASLEAELKRREVVLRDIIKAKDADTAWEKDPEAAAANGLARLVLVIDEFAELKTELPEFINGLVRIARVGRSLGVHLVLATQRPTGAITPEMQSNMNLRVALRVTDHADSADIIGSGEAALIATSTPGRGYMKAGAATTPKAFQTARVAGVRPGHAVVVHSVPPATSLDWDALPFPPRMPSNARRSHSVDVDDTDLRAMVNLAIGAANQAGIPRNPSPWLTPLPESLSFEDFAGLRLPEWSIILGKEDMPEKQLQAPRLWNVVQDSHLLVAGGARSGRTTALRSLLAQLIQRFTPGDLHLYGLDYGNGALLPFATAPHVGAIVPGLDGQRALRLLDRLLAELSRRQTLLSQSGVTTVLEQRAQAPVNQKLPVVVLAIDGWERVSATLGADAMADFRDKVFRVLREGPAAGMAVVVSADKGVPADRISSAINNQYMLPMRDVADYRAAGIMVRELPANLPAGRALTGADAREVQLVVVSRDASGEVQHRTVTALVNAVQEHWAAPGTMDPAWPAPLRVDTLPTLITLAEAAALPLHPDATPGHPVIAVGGDELSRITVELSPGRGFLIVGDRGTGKSTALALLCAQVAAQGRPCFVVAPRGTILSETASRLGVPYVTDMTAEPVGLDEVLAGPVVVFVDDAEAVRDTPVDRLIMADKARRTYVAASRPSPASTAVGGPLAEAKKSVRGLVLQPGSSLIGTQSFGVSIPKTLVGRGTLGEGLVYLGGEYLPGRVPVVGQ